MPDFFGQLDVQRPVNWEHPLNLGLIGRWQVFGRAGNALRDLVRGGRPPRNAAFTGAVGWGGALGRRGGYGSINTDGSSTWANAGTVAALNGATYATIAGWIYRSSTGVSVGFGATNGVSAGGGARFCAQWNSNGNLYISAENGTLNYPSFALSGTGWHHIAAVWDGSQSTDATKIVAYLDGVAKSMTFVGSFTSTLGTATTSTNGFGIGKSGTDQFCGGSYDDVRVWNRSLNASEVRKVYSESLLGSPFTLNWLEPPIWAYLGLAGGNTYTASISFGASASILNSQANLVSASMSLLAALSVTDTAARVTSLSMSQGAVAGIGESTGLSVIAALSLLSSMSMSDSVINNVVATINQAISSNLVDSMANLVSASITNSNSTSVSESSSVNAYNASQLSASIAQVASVALTGIASVTMPVNATQDQLIGMIRVLSTTFSSSALLSPNSYPAFSEAVALTATFAQSQALQLLATLTETLGVSTRVTDSTVSVVAQSDTLGIVASLTPSNISTIASEITFALQAVLDEANVNSAQLSESLSASFDVRSIPGFTRDIEVALSVTALVSFLLVIAGHQDVIPIIKMVLEAFTQADIIDESSVSTQRE